MKENAKRAFLPDQTRFSQVRLRTANVERALEFYSGLLGLKAHSGPKSEAHLSATEEMPGLIVLSEDKRATPRPPHSTGLYHLALRYPTRQSLAVAVRRLLQQRYAITGASDHGVSEAIYLHDPDGNGVELYADRPSASWRWRDGQVEMSTEALDLDGLLASAIAMPETVEPPAQLDLGHIHLQVADLAVAERFYSEFLGLAVTQRTYPGALFLAAGGYHHHIGVNVWAGKKVPPANSTGLISYRLEVPFAEILYCLSHRAPLLGYETKTETANPGLLKIRDPNGNWIEVQALMKPAMTFRGSLCHSKDQ